MPEQTVRGFSQGVEGCSEVCRALVDLSEACSVHVNRNSFRQELKKFMVDHMKRKALIQLLMKIGIWNEK